MPLPQNGAEYTIWGKVMASPESGLWWVLWVLGCLWWVLAPKVVLINLLLVLGACLLEWVNCLSLFLVPSQSSNTPLYPSKVLRTGSVSRAPKLFIVSTLGLNLSLPKGLGLRHSLTCSPYKHLTFSPYVLANVVLLSPMLLGPKGGTIYIKTYLYILRSLHSFIFLGAMGQSNWNTIWL